MTANTDNLSFKYADITPAIKTEIIEAGYVKLVRATVTVGPLVVTSFSDVISDTADLPLQSYALQATSRAIDLILSN